MRASGTAVIDGPAGTNSGEERYLGYAEALAVAGLQVDPAIAHCGLPWVDEALFMLTKHPNFSAELSYFIATITEEELLRFLIRA